MQVNLHFCGYCGNTGDGQYDSIGHTESMYYQPVHGCVEGDGQYGHTKTARGQARALTSQTLGQLVHCCLGRDHGQDCRGGTKKNKGKADIKQLGNTLAMP